MKKNPSTSNYATIIDALYGAALDPAAYVNFMHIWEDRIMQPWVQGTRPAPNWGTDNGQLAIHFQQALEVFEVKKMSGRPKARAFLETQKFAAAIVRQDGRILSCNTSFDDRFELAKDQSLFDRLEPPSISKMPNDGKGVVAIWNSGSGRAIAARYHFKDGTSSLLMIEALKSGSFADVAENELLLVKACQAEWSQWGSDLLVASFGLTPAEIDVAKHLYAGLHSADIAQARNTSLETSRKQIKSILTKVQVTSQGEFIGMATGIMHVVEVVPHPAPPRDPDRPQQGSFNHSQIKKLAGGQSIQFYHYGHPDGTPVLFLHGHTSSAAPPPSLVEAAAANGLQIIAPCKPGIEQTSPVDGPFKPMAFINDCTKVLDSLGISRLAIAGHATSGVYAIEAAARFPERFSAFALLDTGMPLVDESHFLRMPEGSRRIFMTAWQAPEFLYAPFVFAADAFLASKGSGSDFMRSQFEASQHDLNLLEDPEMYRIAHKAMSDFMGGAKRSVDELVYWVSDWTAHLNAAKAKMPGRFIHSEHHDWLDPGSIESFCRDVPNIDAVIISSAAQLFMYDKPHAVFKSLKGLADLS